MFSGISIPSVIINHIKQCITDTCGNIAIGNAPTALVRLYELIEDGKLDPELIIGVPVGFVNVVQSKELIMQAPSLIAAIAFSTAFSEKQRFSA